MTHRTHEVRDGRCVRCEGETGWALLARPCRVLARDRAAAAEYTRRWREKAGPTKAAEAARKREERAAWSPERLEHERLMQARRRERSA